MRMNLNKLWSQNTFQDYLRFNQLPAHFPATLEHPYPKFLIISQKGLWIFQFCYSHFGFVQVNLKSNEEWPSNISLHSHNGNFLSENFQDHVILYPYFHQPYANIYFHSCWHVFFCVLLYKLRLQILAKTKCEICKYASIGELLHSL